MGFEGTQHTTGRVQTGSGLTNSSMVFNHVVSSLICRASDQFNAGLVYLRPSGATYTALRPQQRDSHSPFGVTHPAEVCAPGLQDLHRQ